MISFGERLKAYRLEQGMTQLMLAEQVGLSQSIIASIESRKAQHSKYLAQIAKTLNVSEKWLSTGEDEVIIAVEIEKLLQRFFLLFSVHRIPQLQIPKLFEDEKIKLSTLASKEKLLDSLNDDHFQKLSEIFHINPKWIIGYSDDIYSLSNKSFYKSDILSLASRLLAYKATYLKPEVIFITEVGVDEERFTEAKNKEDNVPRLNVGVIIQLTHRINGIMFTTYDLWKKERWNYSKCRLALKTIMYFCKKHRIEMSSRNVLTDDFERLYQFEEFCATILNKPYAETAQWYPEDFVEKSDFNSEIDEFQFVKDNFKDRGLHELVAPAFENQ